MENTNIIVAPGIQDTDLSSPPTFEDKLKVFYNRMRGWKLDIADGMINGYTADGQKFPAIPDAGYAALDIMFTYFEPIGKYIDGYTGKGASGKYFKNGIHAVFPDLSGETDIGAVRCVEDTLWKAVRCGIYHSGMTQGTVAITSEIEHPIVLPSDKKIFLINPHILVKALMAHLDKYAHQVTTEGQNSDVGERFERRWDHDNK